MKASSSMCEFYLARNGYLGSSDGIGYPVS